MLGFISSIAVVLAVTIVLQLIDKMSQGANQLDENKTSQTIQAGLEAAIEQEAGIIHDNANWDDAAAHVYGTVDADWLMGTWGLPTAAKYYDTAFVVDRDGATMVGYSDGKVSSFSAVELIGPEFKSMLDKFPNDVTTAMTISGIRNTKKGLSVIAMAPILFQSEGQKINGSLPKYILFTRVLNSEYVEEIAQRMVVKGLAISNSPIQQSPSLVIKNPDGSVGAYAAWNADRPGDLVRSSILGTAIAVLIALSSCIFLFIGLASWIARRLHISENKAWGLAHTDSLTQLPNRQALQFHLDTNDNLPKKSGDTILMMLDIDGFKDVNDCYGHVIGDGLIRNIASEMSSLGKKHDAFIARLGGDEFAIVLSGPNAENNSVEFNKNVFEIFAQPFNIDNRIAQVGASIGVAKAETASITGSELLRQADVAMYIAKAQGKGRAVCYQPILDQERTARVDMAKLLSEAIEEHRIEVAYQPVVDAKTRRITGVEALARWQQTPGKFIPPDKFIAVAEEFGLIDRLGNQILQLACQQAAKWPDIHLAVNISPVQFRNTNFVETVIKIVDDTGFKRSNLEFELTEGHLIHSQGKAKDVIDSLRSHGFGVALDDFGTGYSSLGYLRQYKFDRLKIDKSLIKGMTTDHSTLSIVHAAATMARSMNMQVTAEGVEHEEEANLLHLAGCNSLQGYHLGRPQSALAFSVLLQPKSDEASVA
jgi:diguanylate cyclase (GGDEF)-like protein